MAVDLTITAENIQKRFAYKPVFKPVSFKAEPSEIIAITGFNGAGKSTLLKMIGNVLSPTKGTCVWERGGKKMDNDGIHVSIGYVAPYLELYDELTAVEHVELVGKLKGIALKKGEAVELLEGFGLDAAVAKSDRHLRAYSSGMKQRVRCAMAFACAPS